MVTPDASRILDFWEAFDRIEPIGGRWKQAAMIAHEVSINHAVTMATVGGKLDPKPIEDFMPPQYRPPKKAKPRKRGLSMSAMRAKLENS
jgi:hypothetical protein